MSNQFASMIRFAAVASLATAMGTTAVLANDTAPSADIAGITQAIQSKQAAQRQAIVAMVEKSQAQGISPKRVVQLERIHANQAATRQAVGAMLAKSQAQGIGPKRVALVDRIHTKQADNRNAIHALIETSRALGMSPKAVAMQDADSQMATRPSVTKSDING